MKIILEAGDVVCGRKTMTITSAASCDGSGAQLCHVTFTDESKGMLYLTPLPDEIEHQMPVVEGTQFAL